MSSGSGGCVFCRIAAGEIPSFVVYETDELIGFLDTRPLFHGHVLLAPRAHFETLADLDPGLVEPLFRAAQLLSRAIPLAMSADGSMLLINNRVSQSVPHLHVHVIPRRKKDGLRMFLGPRHPYSDDAEARKVQQAIRDQVSRRI